MTENVQGASQILIEDLQARIDELKSNNADLKQRNAFLRQRPDLPVDRIPAYKAMEGRIDELNDYNKKMIENYQSSLDELQAVVDLHPKMLKRHTIDFFRWWWNQGGTNTEQGYDSWLKTLPEHEK